MFNCLYGRLVLTRLVQLYPRRGWGNQLIPVDLNYLRELDR